MAEEAVEKKAKSIFEGGSRDDEGKLNQAPNVPDVFDPEEHKPLKKADFTSDDVFLDYRAHILTWKAGKMSALAEKLSANADNLRKFGDPETRRKALKVSRMREQLAALEKELSEEGVDMTSL